MLASSITHELTGEHFPHSSMNTLELIMNGQGRSIRDCNFWWNIDQLTIVLIIGDLCIHASSSLSVSYFTLMSFHSLPLFWVSQRQSAKLQESQIIDLATRKKLQITSSQNLLKSDLSNPLSKPIAPTQMARAKVEVLFPMYWWNIAARPILICNVQQ